MLTSNENPQAIALSQVIAQRRIQTVSVQKPQQNVQQQVTIDSGVSPGSSQTSPNPTQQTVSQPQSSPHSKN